MTATYDDMDEGMQAIAALNRLLQHPRWAGLDDTQQDVAIAQAIDAIPDMLAACEGQAS